jgi:hypothetical protein
MIIIEIEYKNPMGIPNMILITALSDIYSKNC